MECDAGPGYLTIVECRPPWRKDLGPEWTRFPIARLRYTSTTRRWALHWRDRHLRFHRYDQLPASPHAGDLLQETGRHPIAIFAGLAVTAQRPRAIRQPASTGARFR